MNINIPAQQPLADNDNISLSDVHRPQYGRYLEEYVPGQIFVHPRGYTFSRAAMDVFARTFMQCNPLYINSEFAKTTGFPSTPASPQMVFNIVLSLGVQNDSEKVIANLGYYNARFLRPVYEGDTVTAMTLVTDRKERGKDKPGIVTIRTLGLNQRKQVVLQYERKLMVAYQGDRLPTTPIPPNQASPQFPWQETPTLSLPSSTLDCVNTRSSALTGWNTYGEHFKEGQIIIHNNGRSITDEHLALTYLTGNTHPLHFDAVYSQGLSGQMSGKPIVYGGLVFAWLDGLASRDLSENAIWELGFTEGYHTQPAVSGDTVSAISRVLAKVDAPGELAALYDMVTIQFIGVKNITANQALDKHGASLFIKENDKKALGQAKIPDKIFEIERQLLIRRQA